MILSHAYNKTRNVGAPYFKDEETKAQSINYVPNISCAWQKQDLNPSGVIEKPSA